jgi:hypothetical protein
LKTFFSEIIGGFCFSKMTDTKEATLVQRKPNEKDEIKKVHKHVDCMCCLSNIEDVPIWFKDK